ncbi:MAG: hypothetical protein HY537_17325 [Deltaproteobacteria bacterium]|nr:hypothetical protein [Deltaproteobacteria bacterium]
MLAAKIYARKSVLTAGIKEAKSELDNFSREVLDSNFLLPLESLSTPYKMIASKLIRSYVLSGKLVKLTGAHQRIRFNSEWPCGSHSFKYSIELSLDKKMAVFEAKDNNFSELLTFSGPNNRRMQVIRIGSGGNYNHEYSDYSISDQKDGYELTYVHSFQTQITGPVHKCRMSAWLPRAE